MTSKITNTELNYPLLFTISIIPDFDFLFLSFIHHRGPTHSFIFTIIVCFPFIIIYKKKAIPYFLALLSHSIIGDIYGYNGIQLFWPINTDWIYISNINNTTSALFELFLFITIMIMMLYNKDLEKILFNKGQRIYWFIPLGAVLGPILINTSNYNMFFPKLLLVPSLIFLFIFSYAIIGIKNS